MNTHRYGSFPEIAQFHAANRAHLTGRSERRGVSSHEASEATKFPHRVLSPIINVLANILRASRLEIPRCLLTRTAGTIKRRIIRMTRLRRTRSQPAPSVQDAKRSKNEIRVDDCCPPFPLFLFLSFSRTESFARLRMRMRARTTRRRWNGRATSRTSSGIHAITLPRHIRRRSFHYPPKWRMKCPPTPSPPFLLLLSVAEVEIPRIGEAVEVLSVNPARARYNATAATSIITGTCENNGPCLS